MPHHVARVLFTSSWGHPPVQLDMVIPPPLTASFQPPSACVSWCPQRQLSWMLSLLVFSGCLHIRPLGITGEPRDIGMPQLDPQPELSAHDNPTSMGKPRGRPSNSRSSCLVTGEATPLARPPTPESPETSQSW